MNLISGQDSVLMTSVKVKTDTPGSCNEEITPFTLNNPCQDLGGGTSTAITCPAMVD